jgi:hypothetical protein
MHARDSHMSHIQATMDTAVWVVIQVHMVATRWCSM